MRVQRWLALCGTIVGAFGMLSCAHAAGDSLVGLSDEFSSASSLSKWKLLDKVEGTSARYSQLNISRSREGYLTIVPIQSSWYMGDHGPMIYKAITGNFIATAQVNTRSINNPSSPPSGMFNSAGVIARDPSSGPGRENWVVCNVGMQQSNTGSEIKSTVNSNSQLKLENGPSDGEVRLVRLGDTFTSLRKLRGESAWRVLGSVRRSDMGPTLQVGIMCNGYQSPDIVAEVNYTRFATPRSASDMNRNLP